MAFAAQIKEGIGIQSILTFSVGFFALLIFIATFFNKQSVWKLTRFDLFCGALSIVGFILWQLTKVGDIAIVLSITSDGFASLPTIVKAYKYPKTESAWPWLLAALSGLLTVLTITNWTFANYAFPFYIFIVSFIIFLFSQFKLARSF